MDNANAFAGLTQYAKPQGSEFPGFSLMWLAQRQADANGAPVEIWGRDGWLVICEDPEPEGAEESGWRSVALVAPQKHGPECPCEDCGHAREEIANGAAR